MKLSTCTLFAECVIDDVLAYIMYSTTTGVMTVSSGSGQVRAVPLRSPPHYKDNALA